MHKGDDKVGFMSHGGYHLKHNWMPKFLRLLKREPNFLRNSSTYITNRSGIGSSMVRAIKFYLKLFKITNNNYEMTEFGNLIYKYDKYFEEEETRWVLQYYTGSNIELAPSLYFLHNILKYSEFTRDIFIKELEGYSKYILNVPVEITTLKKEFRMIEKLYTERQEKHPERTEKSYFEEIKLLEKEDNNCYRIKNGRADEIPPEILYYCISEWLEFSSKKQMNINIDNLFKTPGSPFKIFHMSRDESFKALDNMKQIELLDYTRTAGLDVVIFKSIGGLKILKNYYTKLL